MGGAKCVLLKGGHMGLSKLMIFCLTGGTSSIHSPQNASRQKKYPWNRMYSGISIAANLAKGFSVYERSLRQRIHTGCYRAR